MCKIEEIEGFANDVVIEETVVVNDSGLFVLSGLLLGIAVLPSPLVSASTLGIAVEDGLGDGVRKGVVAAFVGVTVTRSVSSVMSAVMDCSRFSTLVDSSSTLCLSFPSSLQ